MTEKLTPEEYDTLVALTAKAERIIEARLPAYVKATGGYIPGRTSGPEKFEYKSRDRAGREASGRYDIEVSYRDWDGDGSSIYVPSALLWDPDGTTATAVAQIAAERAAAEQAEAERTAQYRAAAEKNELARAKTVLRKYGYKVVKS